MEPKDLTDAKCVKCNQEVADVYYLETIEQLQAISDPIRYRMISMMAPKPMTGAQLARALGISRARAHYHLKLLNKVGVVRFCGQAISHGIVEKYYHTVGRVLDFSNLIPNAQKEISTNITLKTFQTLIAFLTILLDVSRDSISQSSDQEKVMEGFYFDFTSVLTPDQISSVKKELTALRKNILRMTRKSELRPPNDSEQMVRFRTTLFLTPFSD